MGINRNRIVPIKFGAINRYPQKDSLSWDRKRTSLRFIRNHSFHGLGKEGRRLSGASPALQNSDYRPFSSRYALHSATAAVKAS